MKEIIEAERFAHLIDVEIWITPKGKVYTFAPGRAAFGVTHIPTSVQ